MTKPFAKRTLKVMEHFRKHPNEPVISVAGKYNMSLSQVYQLRKRVQKEVDILFVDPTPGPTPEHEAMALAASFMNAAQRTAKQKKERAEKYFRELQITLEPNETDVDAVLDSRAQDYGRFIEGAEIMQMLKRLVHNHIDQRNKQLAFDQREALDMIIHKIGRIINGNPDKVDNWVDIAGYAKLVADRLEGNAR